MFLTLRLQKTNVRAPFYFELGSSKVYSWLLAKRIIHLLHQIIVFYVAPNLNDWSGYTWTSDSKYEKYLENSEKWTP